MYVEVLKARMSLLWNIAMVLLNWKLTLTHCALPISGRCAIKLIAEKAVTIMNRRMIQENSPREIWAAASQCGEEDYIWN